MLNSDETNIKQFIQTFLDIVEKQYSVEIEWSLRNKIQKKEPTAEVPQKELLSVKEAAKVLGLGINCVYGLIQEDPTFPYVVLGDRNIKVLPERLPEWKNKLLLQQQNNRKERPPE